jgi:hypothetical protein
LVPDGVFVLREGGVHFEGLALPTQGEVVSDQFLFHSDLESGRRASRCQIVMSGLVITEQLEGRLEL